MLCGPRSPRHVHILPWVWKQAYGCHLQLQSTPISLYFGSDSVKCGCARLPRHMYAPHRRTQQSNKTAHQHSRQFGCRQLKQLADLALQCSILSASCAEVLRSNRQTLQRVALIALSWDVATFASLWSPGPPINMFVKVAILLEARALALMTSTSVQLTLTSKLTAPHFSLDRTLTQLTEAPLAGIPQLNLCRINDDNCLCFHTLRTLKYLAFEQSTLPGSLLAVQQSVTALVFIACCNITAAGLKHITTTAFLDLR